MVELGLMGGNLLITAHTGLSGQILGNPVYLQWCVDDGSIRPKQLLRLEPFDSLVMERIQSMLMFNS
jgi:hypothetical protein